MSSRHYFAPIWVASEIQWSKCSRRFPTPKCRRGPVIIKRRRCCDRRMYIDGSFREDPFGEEGRKRGGGGGHRRASCRRALPPSLYRVSDSRNPRKRGTNYLVRRRGRTPVSSDERIGPRWDSGRRGDATRGPPPPFLSRISTVPLPSPYFVPRVPHETLSPSLSIRNITVPRPR